MHEGSIDLDCAPGHDVQELCEILAPAHSLGDLHFLGINRCAIGRAHVTISRSLSSLANARSLVGDDRNNSCRNPKRVPSIWPSTRFSPRSFGARFTMAETFRVGFRSEAVVAVHSSGYSTPRLRRFHQSFVASRGSSVADVIIDSGGILLTLFRAGQSRGKRPARENLIRPAKGGGYFRQSGKPPSVWEQTLHSDIVFSVSLESGGKLATATTRCVPLELLPRSFVLYFTVFIRIAIMKITKIV